MGKSYYRLVNKNGWVLSNICCRAAEKVFGYGGVWTKDHRKAKRFKTKVEVQKEINKMNCPPTEKFLVIEPGENWKKEYEKNKEKLR